MPKQPNILLFITDQQSAEALSLGGENPWLDTPAMDALAEEGVRFDRAYSPNPLCIPARTSMFTGRYPHATRIQSNYDKAVDLGPAPMLGALLRDAGYDTGYAGKWHIPVPLENEATHGFDYHENNVSNSADLRNSELAAGFIERERGKPFFLVASYNNPHNICEWARGQELHDGDIGEPPPLDECPPLKPNHEPPQGETDIVAQLRKCYQAAWWFPVGDFGEREWRRYRWAYYRMVELVDRRIGQVLDVLQRSGQAEDTVVVFTSDHGDCQGAHRWNQKTVFYEESTRVPLILSMPWQRGGEVNPALVNTGIDLLPTLCGFAGVDPPADAPGMDLSQRIEREFVVSQSHFMQGAEVDGQNPRAHGRMVRSPRYKYCVYSEGVRRESLVDLEADPGEMVNLADDPDHAGALEQHRSYLRAFCRGNGDDFLAFVP